jgi:nucleoside-diphosphate-sugar epimerase
LRTIRLRWHSQPGIGGIPIAAKRVIITGATGFVGANLVRRLLHDGHRIHLFVRPGHALWRIDAVREHIQLHELSLLDSPSLRQAIASIRPDWIFHLAVFGAYPTQTGIHEMISTNISGTVNLVESCLHAGFEAFVNTGSSSEYGWKDHAPSEIDYLEPNSHYAVTKAASTLYCRHIAQARQAHIPTLRLYSVYGPYEEPTRLIPTIITQGLRGNLPPLASPDTARDYVHSDDVVDAYIRAATVRSVESGAVYNIGTGIQTSLRQVVDAAKKVLPIDAEPEWGTMLARSWDSTVWIADNAKAAAELGWAPQVTFEEGLRRTVAWRQENYGRSYP